MDAIVAITAILGLAVGLSLGALGGGGSTLAVPILVFVAGMTAQQATTASLLVVGIAAAVGVVGHYRCGNVRLGSGIAFGLAGIAGSRLGTTINRSLDGDMLLLAFSALVLFVAVRMYRSVPSTATPTLSAAGNVGVVPERADTDSRFDIAALAQLAVAATAVGTLTGLFGVGGGFAVVPALVMFMHFDTKQAIGTSLVVIAINAAMALFMRAGSVHIDWAIVAPFLVTVTAGVLVGSRIANRVDADRLTRAFAVMLFGVAIYTAVGTLV